MRKWLGIGLLGLLAGCGIEKNTEATLEEVRASNAKQDKLVEATIRMEALTKELLGVSKELAKLTGQLQETTRETNASVGRSNEMQSQLLELTKKLAALTETLSARTESVEGNTQRLQSLTGDLLALTKQLAEVTAKMSTQMAAVEGNTEDLETLTQEVARLINQLVQGMDRTNQGVRLQILTVAMQQMLSPEATESLAPPARIFPYAATFAREATAMETLEIFHTFLQDTLYGGINEGAARDRGRKVSLTIGGAIAAFTPHDKLREILSTQVESPGRYIDSARALAACRYVFIRDYLFYSTTAAETLNVATLRAAVEYYRQLRYLAELPYVESLKFQVMGLGGEDIEVRVNPDEMASLGMGAARRFAAELPPDVVKTAEVRALLSELSR